MIKQVGQTFSLVAFTATVDGVTHLVDDKDDFERMTMERITMEARMGAMSNNQAFNRDSFVAALPEISYIANTLSAEQEARLVEANSYKTITLDEARAYIIEGVEPTDNSEYLLKDLKHQLIIRDNEIETLKEMNRVSLIAVAEIYERGLNTN